jgi:hypothetical protein
MCNNMDDTETLRRPYQIAVLQHQNDLIILALCKLRTKRVKIKNHIMQENESKAAVEIFYRNSICT